MLVAAPERWDEACFAAPALRALVASGLGVGVLCAGEQREFWGTIEGLAVIHFPAKAKVKAVAAGIRGGWQAALAWDAGFAAEVFKYAAIPRRLGQEDGRLKKLLTHPLGFFVGPLEHRVQYYLAAAEALGVSTAMPEFFAPISIDVVPVAGAVLLCPDSDFGANHEWSIERWEEIGRQLIESGQRVAVMGADGGRGLGKILAGKLGDEVGTVPSTPLSNILPVLAGYQVVIAADGSLPHLAAHVGATCVVLFGPNDPAWKRPLGRRHAIVRRDVECAPCLLAKCPLDLRCQKELESGEVWQAVQRILRG